MHDNIALIQTLVAGLSAALVLGYVTHRVGLSPIVGYLLGGVAIGPFTPGFVANRALAEQLAEVGVVLLMFGVGLHFHLEKLLAVRRIALPGALGQVFVATILGASAGWAFGWNWSAGLVFGLAISVASTVVLVRVLADNDELHTPAGHVAVGWLVVEDLFTVLVLVLLPAIFGGGAGPANVPLALGLAIVKLAALVAFTLVAGGRVIPWLLGLAAASSSRELFTLTVLAVALGISYGAAMLFGASMALGAFLAGMVVGRSEFSLRAAADALPMRDAFAVLFFVSVGMLFDPQQIVKSPGLIAATLAIILLGKSLAALAIVALLRYPPHVGFCVAVALAQIGEFSFIVGTLGQKLGVLDAVAYQTLVAAAIVSITLNPILYRLIGPMEAWAARRPKLWKLLSFRSASGGAVAADFDEPDDRRGPAHRAVVIGYGPVGRTLTRLLRENGVEPTVVELNLETVHALREQGIAAVYGDASHRETLLAAGTDRAGTIVLSASGIHASEEVIRLSRELNPRIRVLARTAYLRERPALRKAGAHHVFAGEGEVAMAMTASILQQLGATAEQVDRERERVQAELGENGEVASQNGGRMINDK